MVIRLLQTRYTECFVDGTESQDASGPFTCKSPSGIVPSTLKPLQIKHTLVAHESCHGLNTLTSLNPHLPASICLRSREMMKHNETYSPDGSRW